MDYLKHWIPYDLKFVDGQWHCLWLAIGQHHLNEPFFDESISLLKIKKGDNRYISTTGLEILLFALEREAVPISCFIFHVSRCGSTLLSQALSVNATNIVVPEAPIFDQILRMREFDQSLSDDDLKNIFQKTVAWYGQNRTGEYQQYFIKLDSWHVHFYQQLRFWYPKVPFYFLTREPFAIIKSHIKRRGIHTIPGYIQPIWLNIQLRDEHFRDFNYYTELVIDGFYQKNIHVFNENDELNYFYDYGMGVENMLYHFYSKVFNESRPSESSLLRLTKHSKHPEQTFSGDSEVVYEIKHSKLLENYHQLLKQIKSL
ncbi:hypothetical protein [Pedobacter sp.]|uniref:hypothetical protein n=1 Tax=Pedobacter sp. TaxID=1411316 RepID=UPI0031E3C11E